MNVNEAEPGHPKECMTLELTLTHRDHSCVRAPHDILLYGRLCLFFFMGLSLVPESQHHHFPTSVQYKDLQVFTLIIHGYVCNLEKVVRQLNLATYGLQNNLSTIN